MTKHTKCWCAYPAEKCPNVSCYDAFPKITDHRELLTATVHWYAGDVWQPAEIWSESSGEIKFCPVCGRELRR